MGAILDSAENIRQNKENPSRQAHKIEEKLEKDKDKGVKMPQGQRIIQGITSKFDNNPYHVSWQTDLEEKIVTAVVVPLSRAPISDVERLKEYFCGLISGERQDYQVHLNIADSS